MGRFAEFIKSITGVDPSKITGPYPLLAFLLVIVPGFLGYWISCTEEMVERIIIGVIMFLILVLFFRTLNRLINTSSELGYRESLEDAKNKRERTSKDEYAEMYKVLRDLKSEKLRLEGQIDAILGEMDESNLKRLVEKGTIKI